MDEIVVTSESPEMTEAFGEALGVALEPGDRILLRGDLGGGKTTFTRGLLRGLGHPDPREVASPTFALHHRYEGGRFPVDHLDLYRLERSGAMVRQGVLDPLRDPGSATVIEWADRLPQEQPPATVEIDFTFVAEDRRLLHLRFRGVRGGCLRAAFAAAGCD